MMFLEDEHYKQGEDVGLNRKVMDILFYERGQSFDKIISDANFKPKRLPSRKKDKYRELAESNGISFATYRGRLELGWSKEAAATKPIQKSMFPDWVKVECKKNGVPDRTLRKRHEQGYPLEWCVLPPNTSFKTLMLNRIKELENKVKTYESQIS
jgi:hypothetical protein